MESNNNSGNHWKEISADPDNSKINDLIHRSQAEIIRQITETQRLIIRQLIFIILVAISMVVFLIPFFMNQGSGKKTAIGVMIMCYFFMSFYVQFQRKTPHLSQLRKILKEIKRKSHNGHQGEFFHQITRYLATLYEVLFFDRKANKLSCDFLEQNVGDDTAEIEVHIMKSLKLDFIINAFLASSFIVSAILAMVLMGDLVQFGWSLWWFGVLAVNVGILLITCLSLQKKLKLWMEGFIKLRSWVGFIENLVPVGHLEQKTPVYSALLGETLCFCSNCGEPDQKMGTYCQQCGRKIEEI